jgi:hypothetical protein
LSGSPSIHCVELCKNGKGEKTARRRPAASCRSHFVTTAPITGCVLRPGERLSDERVIQETGSYVTAILHFAYEIWNDLGKKDELIPPYFRNNWGRYLEHVASFSLPEEKRFRQVHDGHCTYMQPGEEVFVTPKAILGTCVAGTPEEIAHQTYADGTQRFDRHQPVAASRISAQGLSRFCRDGDAADALTIVTIA